MEKPLLLLDVDGVLVLGQPASAHHVMHRVTSAVGAVHEIWIDSQHGAWLRLLSELFDIVWTTGWENDAPRLLGPLLGLPDFPALTFRQRPQLGRRLDKLPDVIGIDDGDRTSVQHYFGAEVVSGSSGPGSGPEFAAPADRKHGTYRPMWLPLDEVAARDVRPGAVVAAVAEHGVEHLVKSPLLINETGGSRR